MRRFITGTILLVVLFSSVLTIRFIKPNAIAASQQPAPANPGDSTIYLPIIMAPRPMTVYGAEFNYFSDWNINKARDADIYWIRNAAFDWSLIEPVFYATPQYDYTKVNNAGLIAASAKNLRIIGTIKNAPSWAQQRPGYICGPIKSTSMSRFADFVKKTVQIYSGPPYNIHYWEFGNEPDVAWNLVPPNSVFGCWGDPNDQYYGGRYYANMLKAAYPAIKSVNPSLQVLNGGLLLYCDPIANPSGCLPSKFMQGILANGGGSYFDIASFHSYSRYLDGHIKDEDSTLWPNGGQVVGKINYLRSLLGSNKPIFMTESAFACDPVENPAQCTNPDQKFFDLQADYVVSSYLRAWGNGVMGSIWYTLEENSWNYTGLFSGTTPRPGYTALDFLTAELASAKLDSAITTYTGLRGYKFNLLDKKVWVLWSPDGVTMQTIDMPAGVTNIYSVLGDPIPHNTPTIDIIHPTYFEFPP